MLVSSPTTINFMLILSQLAKHHLGARDMFPLRRQADMCKQGTLTAKAYGVFEQASAFALLQRIAEFGSIAVEYKVCCSRKPGVL